MLKMFRPLVVTIVLGISLIELSVTQEFSCDYRTNKEDILLGKPNCGENQCRCIGEVARCVGNRYTNLLPRLERTVMELYVECYVLLDLNQSFFENIGLLDIQRLHLLRNEINNISKDIFKKFDHLSYLEISDNPAINKHSLYSALGSLPKQVDLSLKFNNIGVTEVTDSVFQNVNKSNVKYLSLDGNRIATLNLTVLSQLPSLQELRLRRNWINGTSGKEQLINLEMLDLAQNELHKEGINSCLDGGISAFPKIKTILLSDNLLSTLDTYASSWSCLGSLEVLNLKNNTFKSLNMSFFSSMTMLKKLNVGSNWIQKVTPGKYPPNLMEIDFRNNQLVAFPPALCDSNSDDVFPSINKLNFSRNYIQRIMTDNWKCLPNITTLDFSKNDVSLVKNNTFVNFTSLKELYLDNMIPWVKNIEPAAFNSSTLQTLSIRFDWIDFRKKEMQGIFRFCPNVKVLDVSYNYFVDLDEATVVEILSPMKRLEVLKAQRISLKKFPATFLTAFKHLEYLDINRNLLDTIHFPDNFNNQTLNLSIRYISSAEGDINTINQSAFPVSIMNSLVTLDVNGNEFACNCKMQWFRDKIDNGRIGKIKLKSWPEKYVCRSPTSLVGTLLKDFEPDEECWYIKPVTIALIAVGSSLFVFTVLASTAYYNRWYIQYYWYKLVRRRREAKYKEPEERPILDEIQFDGYVVYNSGDDAFVHHPFLQLLEKKFNYTLHIWERNATNGALVDVILDAIYASKHVIVVVSNNLMKDPWCKFQVDVGIDLSIELGRNYVLLVVLENINLKVISKSWCVLLTKCPTVYWSNAEDEDDVKRKFFELTVKQHLGKPLNVGSNGCVHASN